MHIEQCTCRHVSRAYLLYRGLKSRSRTVYMVHGGTHSSHKHAAARPWKQLGQSTFNTNTTILHTCMHIMCTCRNVSGEYLLYRGSKSRGRTAYMAHSHTHSSHKHTAAKPWKQLGQSAFNTNTTVLHTCMHTMCTCRNVSRACLFHRGHTHAHAKHTEDVDAIRLSQGRLCSLLSSLR